MDYERIYTNIVSRARVENNARVLRKKHGEYFERHHIKPKSIGGTNTKDNLVYLTAREHFICHALLIRFLRGDALGKMRWAFFRLCSCSKKNNPRHCGYVNARLYETFKQSFQSGCNNSQFGCKWWVHKVTGKAIKSVECPGDDWLRGRSLETISKIQEKQFRKMKYTDMVTGKRIGHNALIGTKLNARVQIILSSGVNLSRMGWVAKVMEVTGLSRRQIYMAYNKSSELQAKCFRRLPSNELSKRHREAIQYYIDAGVQPDKRGRFTPNLLSEYEWNRRKNLITSCGIDLMKCGWVARVSSITGMPKYEIYAVIKHFSDFKNMVYLRKRTNVSLA